MKTSVAKWLNLIALVLLYAISAISACILISIFSKYILDIAENIRNYAYLGVSTVALGLLFFRRIKTPPTKLAKFELVIAILLAVTAFFVLGGGLLSIIDKYGPGSEEMVKFSGWCYLFFAAIAPITLMLLSKFTYAKALLSIATGVFSLYAFSTIIIAILYYIDFIGDAQVIMSLLLVSIPLIFFCILSFMSLQLIKSTEKSAYVARFQNKRSLWGLIFTIVFALITVLIVSIDDLYSIGIFTSMLSFILFALIPSALYFVIMKIACFKYKREEGEKL